MYDGIIISCVTWVKFGCLLQIAPGDLNCLPDKKKKKYVWKKRGSESSSSVSLVQAGEREEKCARWYSGEWKGMRKK